MRRPISSGHGKASLARALGGIVCMLSPLLSASAQAQQPEQREHCTASARSWIAMQTPHASDDELVSWPQVVRHVGSELLLREVELCTAAKTGRPLATLQLERTGPTGVRMLLWALDPEQVLGERTIDLALVPADARLLSIAVAADELLAANLRELEQRAEQARARPKTPTAKPTLSSQPSARGFYNELGLAFVGDVFGGGQQLLGVDVSVAVRLGRRWAPTLRFGMRQGLPAAADHGTAEAAAYLIGLGLRVEALAGPTLKLDLLARMDALSIGVRAYPNAPDTVAPSASGFAVVTSGGLGVRGVVSRRLQLVLDGNVGGAAHAVHFTDTGRRVSGVSGLALSAGGGVLVSF